MALALTDDEQAMLDGRGGPARQKAMDLLVRYAEALGAERFVDTKNVAGVPGSANPFLQNYYRDKGDGSGGTGRRDAIFSYFVLDADNALRTLLTLAAVFNVAQPPTRAVKRGVGPIDE